MSSFNLDENEIDIILTHMTSDQEGEGGVATIEKTKVRRPKLFRVLLHNDDYTTMDFVIMVLKRFFGKTDDEAQAIMLKVHHEGSGLCGTYTYEIAETKVAKVMKEARKREYPLLCTMEPE